MQHYGLTLAPGVLFTYIKRTVLVMVGKLSIDDAFQANISGLWQAIWARSALYLVLATPISLRIDQNPVLSTLVITVWTLLLVLILISVLKLMGLESKQQKFIVPFLWILIFQDISGLTTFLVFGQPMYIEVMQSTGQFYIKEINTISALVSIIFFFWSLFWLGRVCILQLGSSRWVAAGLVALIYVIPMFLKAIATQPHLPT